MRRDSEAYRRIAARVDRIWSSPEPDPMPRDPPDLEHAPRGCWGQVLPDPPPIGGDFGGPFLGRPFNPQELVRMVERVIGPADGPFPDQIPPEDDDDSGRIII